MIIMLRIFPVLMMMHEVFVQLRVGNADENNDSDDVVIDFNMI